MTSHHIQTGNSAERSSTAFSTIAQLWDVYLDAKPSPGRTISAYDVANMMALMKIARLAQEPSSPDSAIDLAAMQRARARS